MNAVFLLAVAFAANGVNVDGTNIAATERRDFDDGFAVRYVLPEGERRISGEDTSWTLPGDAKVWYQAAQGGFGIDYEAPYTVSLVKDIPAGRMIAMPLTAKMPDGSYVLITEANVVDYTDSALVCKGDGVFAVKYYADPGGFSQQGAATTPWRVTLTAKDLQALATSDIVRRLCPEPPAERAAAVAERFAAPGRCVWHWLPMGDPKFDEQKDWYDKTKALGFEYYLIDEGWRKWGDDTTRWQKLKECIDYGKSIGVQTFIWVNSNEMRTAEERRAYLAKTAASGAVGIKIDFIPKPDYATMKWYEDTLADTFAAGLRVDFHGCVKPTGREKTWPHEIAREAIRGHEWHITRYHRILPPEHDTILPFSRLVQGHGDYTPLVFNPKELIHFTWARQLAQPIVFACPFLCFGDYPQNYLDNPARDFIMALCATYDETRILPGSEIGECVAVARRKGNEWFIGIENGRDEREIAIDFSFIGEKMRCTAFGDSPDGRLDAYATEFSDVGPGDVKRLKIRGFGGWAARLTPIPPKWEDPQANAENRLPARAIVIPCESEDMAVLIARLSLPRYDSAYVQSLNGTWNFSYTPNSQSVKPGKSQAVTVPGCWQLQGDFDPPLYVGDQYAFPVRPPVASGLHPEMPALKHKNKSRDAQADWTIWKYPDPVGIYERDFTVPAEWEGRRIAIHFGGVSSAMTLFVNGREIGYSEDSRLPAEFDITDALRMRGARNKLRVVVRKHCDGSYLEDQDFWRLSGIFRDVWLVAEKKDGLRDFVVDADAATGEVSIRDEKGNQVYWTKVGDVKLWSPESPQLYTAAFQVAGDWFAVNFAFRTVAIEDGVFKLNGERVLFKGVNRHEISPVGGYAMTHAEMERDIRLLKEFGFNAVRTCHYPDDPYWYDLCDKYGIMLVSEANIESHGMNERFLPGARDFANRPEWEKAHLERGGRMVATFRNHPSVVMWSMGNECDMGPAFERLYAHMKSLDPQKRPVQYERVFDYSHLGAEPYSDTICPMYSSPAAVEECVRRDTSKPFVFCEYAHAMGNSTGDFADYWALAEKYPTFQGGFIWDFADQGLLSADGSLKYGGDFGDRPNSGCFCCNGIFDSLRRPHPGAFEVKEVFAKSTKNPKCETPDAASLLGTLAPNFLRASTDNDRPWARRIAPWRDWAATGRLPAGCSTNLVVTRHPDGSATVDWRFTLAPGVFPPPRIGLTFTVPAAFTNVTWVGRGPHENYCDRKAAAHFGTWSMGVDELNASGYIRPQECGYRSDVSRLELSDGKQQIVIETLGAPFGFNVWPWTQEDLEKAEHQEDLKKRDFLTVNIDAAMMGVGGDDSWGAMPHPQYRPAPGEYRLNVEFRMMNAECIMEK